MIFYINVFGLVETLDYKSVPVHSDCHYTIVITALLKLIHSFNEHFKCIASFAALERATYSTSVFESYRMLFSNLPKYQSKKMKLI